LQRKGIRYIGVVTKFSVHNPEHEKAMAAIVAPYCEQVFMGHQFSGNLNFPRRIATTYLNAAVYPVHKSFFEAVKGSLKKKGIDVPIRILKPDGGNMNFESSFDHPALTILSGPSASVMGALASAPKSGASLILDIGGTTTDMAIFIDGVPLLAPLGIEIGPYKTLIRALRPSPSAWAATASCACRTAPEHRPGPHGPGHGFRRPDAHPHGCVLHSGGDARRRP
jgi:N-methylhydantoinase A